MTDGMPLVHADSRSLVNMRTVLSHYLTLLDDYRAPGGSFPETMNSAPHRGFLGDHRSVVSFGAPLLARS